MAVEPVLARHFDLTVNTGTEGSPVWTPIAGITGITPGGSSQKTDDTDFDNDGWDAHSVVQRGRSLSVAMNYKEDPDTNALDLGQQTLIDLGNQTGLDAKAQFRYLSPGGTGYIARFSVDLNFPGGDKVNNATFSADLTMDGAPTEVTP